MTIPQSYPDRFVTVLPNRSWPLPLAFMNGQGIDNDPSGNDHDTVRENISNVFYSGAYRKGLG
jgi:hypothetical protein